MQYGSNVLKQLQEIELEILEEVIRVCRENCIPYFTVGGTSLGAVRHNGFIPWDDDIDIGMMRDDYERFLKIAPKSLKQGFFLQHYYTDPNAPTYFAKVRKDGTLFVEKSFKKLNMHHGIFIDIFPHDYVPEKEREREIYNNKARFWNFLYISKTIWISSDLSLSKSKALALAVARTALHILLILVPKKYLYKKTDESLRHYNNEGSKMTSSRGLSVFECYEQDIFPTSDHAFEHLTVSIPKNIDKVLRVQYGEYMCLPPENKRVNHAPLMLAFDDKEN